MPIAVASRATRLVPLAGPTFAAFFVGGVVASSPPNDNAPDATWIANYTGHAHQLQHVVTGLCLVLAGLCLMIFLVGLWQRIADERSERSSPLPLVSAAVSAACMAAGGIVMGVVSATELMSSHPLPDASVLRLSNELGFGLAGVAGMLAAALCVVTLSVQGHAVGLFGRRMLLFGEVTAAALIFSFLFVPIVALLAWVIAAAVSWRKAPAPTPARVPARVAPAGI